MKRIYYMICSCILLATTLLSTACTDEAIVKQSSQNIKEGVPVELKLDFTTGQHTVVSRYTQDAETEYHVSTIYLLVFNTDGTIDTQNVATITGGDYNGTITEGTIKEFSGAHSGANKKIYAVANAEDNTIEELKKVTKLDDLKTIMVSLSSIGDINRGSFLMEGVPCSSDGKELESVTITDTTPAKVTDGTNEVTLRLRRVDARVKFEINLAVTEATDDNYEVATDVPVSFTPRSFKVYQLPHATSLFNGNFDQNKAEITYDNTMYEEDVRTFQFDSELNQEKDAIYFNFYMYENHQDAKKTIDNSTPSNGAKTLYALRETQDKTDKPESDENPGVKRNGAFTYAPENGTYVVFSGDLMFEQTNAAGDRQYVNASVDYTVHLGETGGADKWDDVYAVNNYTVNRNTFYTYTVTIAGVNSIKVEVESENGDEEPRPGMEGDVVVGGGQVESMDSHFGRALIKISRKAITDGGLSWVIQTPFDRGMKTYNGPNNLKDYKWVLFAINSHFGITNSTEGVTPSPNEAKVNMVKFPGYSAYDGGSNTINDVPTEDTDKGNNFDGNTWKTNLANNTSNFYYNYRNATFTPENSNVSRAVIHNDACLRDVNQLINYLTSYVDRYKNDNDTDPDGLFEMDEDGNLCVYITAFVDEYLYTYNPTEQEYTSPETLNPNTPDINDRLLLWKKVVNKEPRMLHICSGGASYSQDGNSSWSNSVVTFKQSPIYSIYNVDENDTELISAWGTESIIEGGVLQAQAIQTPLQNFSGTDENGQYHSYSNSDNNGRINTLLFFVNSDGSAKDSPKWGDILNRTSSSLNNAKGNELKMSYRDIWHACMMRNRDLNGDNKIQAGEVRWYLASIDELTDIWIGQDALPASARLYQGNGTQRWHVASSSYYATKTGAQDPTVIWAEEGASKGAYSASKGTNANGTSYYYRCIRSLGISFHEAKVPQDYVIPTKIDDTHWILDLSRLASWAKRPNYDTGRELARHTERGSDAVNRPYEKFEVSMDAYGLNDYNYPSSNANSKNMNWSTFSSRINYLGRSQLCPYGYRVPNQRELMLMYTSITNWRTKGGNYWCATRFSYNSSEYGHWTGNVRPGFAWNDVNMILVRSQGQGSDNIAAKVRCVKDIKTGN